MKKALAIISIIFGFVAICFPFVSCFTSRKAMADSVSSNPRISPFINSTLSYNAEVGSSTSGYPSVSSPDTLNLGLSSTCFGDNTPNPSIYVRHTVSSSTDNKFLKQFVERSDGYNYIYMDTTDTYISHSIRIYTPLLVGSQFIHYYFDTYFSSHSSYYLDVSFTAKYIDGSSINYEYFNSLCLGGFRYYSLRSIIASIDPYILSSEFFTNLVAIENLSLTFDGSVVLAYTSDYVFSYRFVSNNSITYSQYIAFYSDYFSGHKVDILFFAPLVSFMNMAIYENITIGYLFSVAIGFALFGLGISILKGL